MFLGEGRASTCAGAPQALPEDRDRQRVVFFISLLVGCALLAVAILLLSPLAPPAVDPGVISREIYFEDPNSVQPEPLERFRYVVGVLLAPIFLAAAYLGARRFAKTAIGREAAARFAPAVSWLSAPLIITLVLSAGYAEGVDMGHPPIIALCVLVAILIGAAAAATGRLPVRAMRILKASLIGVAGFLLLAIFSSGIIGVEHIRKIPIYQASFNAFFHSVVQVYFGKALLINFSNQYGLYPHFLEPLFRVVGLNVYSFTAVMALLNVLSFACFYRFLAAETSDEVLSLLALTTLLYFGYVSGRLREPADLYLQYHPLRVLFPALSMPLALRYARSPSSWLGAGFAALGAAAFLWNPDSGMPVLAAALLLPCYDALARRRFGAVPTRLLHGSAAIAAFLAIFSVAMRLRYGAFPDFPRFFAASKSFYGYGVMMLPMPGYGLWVPVIAVYALGLLRAMAGLIEGTGAVRPRLYFFLSVIGLGAFTYYQGRSIGGNLLAASYPAVLVLALLVDDLRRWMLPATQFPDRILAVTLVALLAFSVPALAVVSPTWVRKLEERVRVARSGGDPGVMADVAFARDVLHPGEKVVILSYLSGLYHLASRTTNPLDGSGDSELTLRKDFEEQAQYVYKMREATLIDLMMLREDTVDLLCKQSPVVLQNPQGTLILLGRR